MRTVLTALLGLTVISLGMAFATMPASAAQAMDYDAVLAIDGGPAFAFDGDALAFPLEGDLLVPMFSDPTRPERMLAAADGFDTLPPMSGFDVSLDVPFYMRV